MYNESNGRQSCHLKYKKGSKRKICMLFITHIEFIGIQKDIEKNTKWSKRERERGESCMDDKDDSISNQKEWINEK